MLWAKKAKKRPVLKNKTRQDIIERLDAYLNQSEGKPIEVLSGFWKDQQDAITYQEIRGAIKAGKLSQELLANWHQDYSIFVKNYMEDWWKQAMAAGSVSQQIFTNMQERGFRFDPTSEKVLRYVENHSAQLVTRVTGEQRDAIKGLLTRSIIDGHSTDELARVIRPCVGLNARQAAANLKYYDHVKKTLQDNYPKMKPGTAQSKAQEAAVKYAEKQHRYRAQMIARTENAFAYNQGAEAAAQQAYEQGWLGEFSRIWCVSGSENICNDCQDLDGSEVDKILIPPLHPHCGCAIQYVEKDKSKRPQQNIPQKVDYIEVKGKEKLTAGTKSDLEKELELIPASHRGIIESELKSIQIITEGNSRFDREKGIMYLRHDFEKGEAAHELAHLLETKLNLWENNTFLNIVRHELEDFSLEKIMYVPDEYAKIVYFATGPKFVTEYQARLYDEFPFFDDEGGINPYALGEYFSEGYKVYLLEPEVLLMKDKKLYYFIRSLI